MIALKVGRLALFLSELKLEWMAVVDSRVMSGVRWWQVGKQLCMIGYVCG